MNVINIFHDVNSTLYTVTSIRQGQLFTYDIKLFHSANSALFTKTLRNSQKFGNKIQDLTEDSGVK